MGNSLLITGAGGFVGSRLLQKIDFNSYESIYCLDINQDHLTQLTPKINNLKIIKAGIQELEKYQDILPECRTIIHLAAATGKAITRDAYFQVNVSGTQTLVKQCEVAHVENFLYFSTIAVRYPDKTHYDYAQSKEQSEHIIQSSRLKYSIIRPTIVLGENGATWKSLLRMVKLPIIPLFGDGKTKVQPIYVDDMIDCVNTILDQNRFRGEVIEIGGPEAIAFKDLLAEIHYACFKRSPRFVRLPYRQTKNFLGILENRFTNTHLPINAGQLSAFGNDGTIIENDLFLQKTTRMKNVQEIVNLSLGNWNELIKDKQLDRECQVYSKYLIQQVPGKYVVDKYHDAHKKSRDLRRPPKNKFDEVLIKLSSKTPFMTKIVDSYAALFFKNSLFRKKVIVLMAILENSPLSYLAFEAPDSKSPFLIALSLGLRGIYFVFTLAFSLLLFIPLRIFLSITRKIEA